MRFHLFSLITFTALASVGCWIDADRRATPATQNPETDPPTTTPPRVSIETGRALHAEPGGGAGVFITYATGGQWKVFWTCDTKVVPQHACKFELAVGTLGIQEISSLPTTALVESDATTFRAKTITTTTIDSVNFRTEPGTAIAITMRIDDKVMPNLIWYVSDGKLTTAPSDPIELVPSAP